MNERSFIFRLFTTPDRIQPGSAHPNPRCGPDLFAKRGFHQASIHDIAAEAGISVGLIYRYFENKEAVISAMADRHTKEISEVLDVPAGADAA